MLDTIWSHPLGRIDSHDLGNVLQIGFLHKYTFATREYGAM